MTKTATGMLRDITEAAEHLVTGEPAPAWLRASREQAIPFGMAQQHADELSAERQLADAMNLLEASPKLRAMRLRLKTRGKPFSELTLVQRLVVLIDEYDEVINE